jgi:hypothetical protein
MSASDLPEKHWTQRLALPLLVITTCAYLYWRFRKVFACPSCYLYSNAGDGLKNYFTSAYWVHHDTGLWFHGMNYPYGEHPVYTDNQPIWSLLMKVVNLFTPMQEHVIGTINMLLVISLLVGVIAIYLLLRMFDLPRWYAALVSLPIIFLSPQIARFTGHYSLAYVCYLPLFLLFFVRWARHGMQWKGGVLLALWIAWMGFTHLYFFFIAVAFLMSCVVVLWIQHRFKWRRQPGKILALVVLSGLLVYAPVKLSDPIDDRPKEVYGLYVYTATPVGTFLPWHGTWEHIWEGDLGFKHLDTESKSYLGIFGILLAPFILGFALSRFFGQKRREDFIYQDKVNIGTLAWAGFIVWFFATGWFYQAGGSVLVDTFPVLGQFRSLGRLAWVSYYTYICFAAWFLYQVWKNVTRRWLKVAVTIPAGMVLIFWILEADDFTYYNTASIYHLNETFRGNQPYNDVLASRNLKPDDFQAILQIPLMFIGTDNLLVMRGHWEFNNTFQCSWETGLPIVNYNMSRTSVGHALSMLQLISTPDVHKTRLDDMDDRPLLLLTYKAQHLPTEQRLVDLGEYLGSVGTMDVYKLEVNAFYATADTVSDAPQILLKEGFESQASTQTLSGTGAALAKQDEPFFTYSVRDSAAESLQFSCWVFIGPETPGFPALRVTHTAANGDQLDEQVHSIHSFDPWQVRGNWVEITFPLQHGLQGSQYTFSTLNYQAIVDEVTISTSITR